MNYYLDKAKELGADGIDFVPISLAFAERDYAQLNIIVSYSTEELENIKWVPKTDYLFWKMRNGKKEYL